MVTETEWLMQNEKERRHSNFDAECPSGVVAEVVEAAASAVAADHYIGYDAETVAEKVEPEKLFDFLEDLEQRCSGLEAAVTSAS